MTRLTLLPFEVLWRCDGCGMEQITPRDDPPAKCPRCQHPSVFFVRTGDDETKWPAAADWIGLARLLNGCCSLCGRVFDRDRTPRCSCHQPEAAA